MNSTRRQATQCVSPATKPVIPATSRLETVSYTKNHAASNATILQFPSVIIQISSRLFSLLMCPRAHCPMLSVKLRAFQLVSIHFSNGTRLLVNLLFPTNSESCESCLIRSFPYGQCLASTVPSRNCCKVGSERESS